MSKKFVLAGFLLICSFSAQGQENQILPISDPAYEYINQLQHHGFLLELNPNSLPYIKKEVLNSLRKVDSRALNSLERNWYDQLVTLMEFSTADEQDNIDYGIDFEAGLDINNSRRLNTLRPLDQNLFLYPSGSLGGYLESSNFIGQMNIRHNLYYIKDPDGLDAARRLYIRSEDSYLGYNGSLLNIYFGRFKNHWAPFGETSSILSSNPYSYDQLNIRFGTDKISFRGIFAELDNIGPDNNYTRIAIGSGSKRRYLVAHRFDWRPSNHFGIALFESVIFSGANSGFSFKYFNPLMTYTFVTDNAPKNDENNLMMGGLLWAQWNGFTLNGQLMIDDFQVESNIEKNTFTITGSLVKANMFDDVDAGIEFEAVSYQTYNPEQPEGRYLYLKKGLATQFNDYIRAELYADIYFQNSLQGLRFTPKLELLYQGEQTINQQLVKTYPDGSPIDIILTGDEEQTIRPGLEFRYQRNPNFWIEGDVGYNTVQNYRHQPDSEEKRFTLMLRLGFDFALLRSE